MEKKNITKVIFGMPNILHPSRLLCFPITSAIYNGTEYYPTRGSMNERLFCIAIDGHTDRASLIPLLMLSISVDADSEYILVYLMGSKMSAKVRSKLLLKFTCPLQGYYE